ncbi:MAG: hypothetical protein WD768_20890 [Phycisphaeraceae bacterium]
MAAALFAVTLLAGVAAADEVKIGNFWYKDFAVVAYDNGSLSYQIGGNDNKKPLTDFQGFKLSAYPQLETAEKAVDADNTKEALANFKSARGRVKEAWLRVWLDARLFPLMEKEGEALGAVNTYVALIEAKAPQKFLQSPPLRAASTLPNEDKIKLQEKFKALRKTATDRSPLADSLDEMIDVTVPGAAPVNPDGTNPPVGTGDKLVSVVPMPDFLLSDPKADQITRLLARGKFAESLARVDEEMKTSAGGGRTSMLLYHRGMSEFNLGAELEKEGKATEAEVKYKDAGLSFMRVAIYFRNSPYVIPSLMEAGAVHLKIKRADLAGPLLKQVEGNIDPDDKPMKARFDKLMEQLNSSGK